MYNFSVLSNICFGEGLIYDLPEIVKKYGDRIFLVTDYDESFQRGFLGKIKKSLEKNNCNLLLCNKFLSLMSGMKECEEINRATDQALSARCNVVIGLGREEVLYSAKAITYLMSNGGNIEDYFLDRKGNKKKVVYIEIPTSFGFITGISNFFYVGDKYDNIKKSVKFPNNYADIVIVDPKLSLNMDFKQIVETGLSLLAIVIDSLVSKKISPIAEPLAIKSIELIINNLNKSIQDQDNIEFKSELCNAAILGSLAIVNSSPGIIFALSLAIRSVCNISLALCLSILMPYVMDFNISISATNYLKIAKLYEDSIKNYTVIELGLKAIEKIRSLLEEFNWPTKLSEIGVKKSELADIVRIGYNYNFLQYSPRLLSIDDLNSILNSAF